jgi:hypothetical protein
MAARNISGLPTQRRSAILRFPTLAMTHGVSTSSVSMAQQQRFQQRSPAQLLVLACPASYWHLVVFSAGGGGGGNSHQPSAEHFQQCAEFLPLRNRGLGPHLAIQFLASVSVLNLRTCSCWPLPTRPSPFGPLNLESTNRIVAATPVLKR